ncbi:MAG: DUF547 domain-containing protein [Proteobacteria bacterium]|nr:DUF547 domain-containing protein [Pseudomonadota bacterium]
MIRLLPAFLVLAACRTPMDSPVAASPKGVWIDYDSLLKDVVDERGYVDYDALEADREPLDAMVRYFAERRLFGSADERGAIWLNAYNAFVLFSVLENGRPDSVKDVDGWLPIDGAGFFLDQSYAIDANHYNLWEIEHERIRLRRLDYRIHGALNCGSMSCPPLRRGIFTGDRLNRQLDGQMRAWVNDPDRGVRIEDGKLLFSPLFEWYADDFSRWSGALSPCVVALQYADEPLNAALRDHEIETGCAMETFEYDWSLNVSPGPAAP